MGCDVLRGCSKTTQYDSRRGLNVAMMNARVDIRICLCSIDVRLNAFRTQRWESNIAAKENENRTALHAPDQKANQIASRKNFDLKLAYGEFLSYSTASILYFGSHQHVIRVTDTKIAPEMFAGFEPMCW
jgi:hypothetical protein